MKESNILVLEAREVVYRNLQRVSCKLFCRLRDNQEKKIDHVRTSGSKPYLVSTGSLPMTKMRVSDIYAKYWDV